MWFSSSSSCFNKPFFETICVFKKFFEKDYFNENFWQIDELIMTNNVFLQNFDYIHGCKPSSNFLIRLEKASFRIGTMVRIKTIQIIFRCKTFIKKLTKSHRNTHKPLCYASSKIHYDFSFSNFQN